MKKGCLGVHVAVPCDNVHSLDRLAGSRTSNVNRAIEMYLEVQGPAVNRYGVDCNYFRNKLQMLAARLDSFTPSELRLAFLQLEAAVRGEALNEQV